MKAWRRRARHVPEPAGITAPTLEHQGGGLVEVNYDASIVAFAWVSTYWGITASGPWNQIDELLIGTDPETLDLSDWMLEWVTVRQGAPGVPLSPYSEAVFLGE